MAQSGTSSPSHTQAQRREIRSLLAAHEPGDARTAFYALEHSPQRTTLALHRSDSGHVDGFLAICITGANPFQPLVVLRAFGPSTLEALICEALTPGQPYLFSVPVHVGTALGEISCGERRLLTMSETAVWRILRTDASRFQPLVNVLVTQERSPGGLPRWQIRAQGRVIAAAGVNWTSSRWAELYVTSGATGQARRWDESALAAATSALLGAGLVPLYPVLEKDRHAQQVAEALGYYYSGAREFAFVGTMG